MFVLVLMVIAGLAWWFHGRMTRLEDRILDLEAMAFVPQPSVRATEPLAETAPAERVRAEAAPEPEMPPEPEPEPLPVPEPLPLKESEQTASPLEEPEVEHEYRRPRFDFEDIFGRLLPIWGGGIALAIAGFFLVRWSIEMGLLTEWVRVSLGMAFGIALIAAAEVAYRLHRRLDDERVRQALSGAGIATLYASFYLAGTYYDLIGAAAGFAGLAAVTALAVGLSYRFGLPSAVLGLVGGFAAPALAGGTEPNIPLLATYLALVTGGLCVTGERQRRPWLGIAALAGGLGWGALMLLSGPAGTGAILVLGGYLVLLGALLPSLLGAGPLGQIGRIAAAGLATLEIAALVETSGYSLLAWGCYVLLATALAVLGRSHPPLRDGSAVAAAVSASLLAAWPDASPGWFALVAGSMALILAGAPLWNIVADRARTVDWAQVALFPLVLVGAICVQFGVAPFEGSHAIVALAALTLALAPAFAAAHGWPEGEAVFEPAPLGTGAAALALLVLAGWLAVPGWAAPLVTAVLAAPACYLLRGRGEDGARLTLWALAVSGIAVLAETATWSEFERLFGWGEEGPHILWSLRWLAAAIPFALLVPGCTNVRARKAAEGVAAFFAYGAAAMLLPEHWLPLAVAVAAVALAWRLPAQSGAQATVLVIGGAWALGPLAEWLIAGIEAVAGEPFLVTALPGMADMLRTVALLAAAVAGLLLLRASVLSSRSRGGWAAVGALLLVLAHAAWKQVFAIDGLEAFAALGLAERTGWQALLALAALALASRYRSAALVAGMLSLGHFALFTLLLHNPLLTEQAVGSLPLVNWLLPAYGIAIGLLAWSRGRLGETAEPLRPVLDAAIMVLVALLTLSELRHVFAGSVLVAQPMSQQEDLLRSLLAILLALGFLGWGAWRGERSWRIGSLVLMLLAVCKVFVFDAAGLEGLARIASFFALGICLIGIGWFYTRQLVRRGEDAPSAVTE